MSVKAMAAAMELEVDALFGAKTSTVKWLLTVVGNYADEEHKCWPSNKELRAKTGLSERTIRDTLNLCEREGLIRRDERFRRDGSQSSDLIFLLFVTSPPKASKASKASPEGSEVGGAKTAGGGANSAGGGAPDDRGVGQPGGGGGAKTAPLASLEPTTEPSEEPSANAASAREPVFEDLWEAYPHVQGRSKPVPARKQWDALSGLDRPKVVAAALRYRAEGAEARGSFGAPCLANWLAAESWRPWLPNGPGALAPVRFDVPDDLVAAVVTERDQAFAVSYLTGAVVEEGVLWARSTYAAKELRLLRCLAERGLTVQRREKP